MFNIFIVTCFNIFTNLTNVHTLLVCRTSYDHDYVFYDYRYVDTKKDDVALSLFYSSNIETLNYNFVSLPRICC